MHVPQRSQQPEAHGTCSLITHHCVCWYSKTGSNSASSKRLLNSVAAPLWMIIRSNCDYLESPPFHLFLLAYQGLPLYVGRSVIGTRKVLCCASPRMEQQVRATLKTVLLSRLHLYCLVCQIRLGSKEARYTPLLRARAHVGYAMMRTVNWIELSFCRNSSLLGQRVLYIT